MANDAKETSPARKATPRKAAAAARASVGRRTTGKAALTAATFPAEAPAAAKADTITFLGRTMAVQMPTPEQLVVWNRLSKRLQSPEAQAMMDDTPRPGETQEDANKRANEYAAAQLDRMLTLTTSVLTDPVDHEWVEDQVLTRRLRLAGAPEGEAVAADIIAMAVEHFTGRRAKPTAPATGPQPRARRRA